MLYGRGWACKKCCVRPMGWGGAHGMGVGSVAGVGSGWGSSCPRPPHCPPLYSFPFSISSPPHSHPLDPGPGARPQPVSCWPKQDLFPGRGPGTAGGRAGPEGHRHHSVFPSSSQGLPGPQVRAAKLCQMLWAKSGCCMLQEFRKLGSCRIHYLTPTNCLGAHLEGWHVLMEDA